MQLVKRRKNGRSGTAEAAQRQIEAAFDGAGAGASFKVYSRNERGHLQYLSSPADLTSENVENVLKDLYGGGRFCVVPVGQDGRKSAAGFELDIAGDPKPTKKAAGGQAADRRPKGDKLEDKVAELERKLEEKDKEEKEKELNQRLDRIEAMLKNGGSRRDVLDSLLANLPQLVTGVSSLAGSRETASEMMERLTTTIKNLQNSVPQAADPMQQLTQLAEFMLALGQSQRAPVSTTGPVSAGGSWAGGFFGSLLAGFDRDTGGKLSQALSGLSSIGGSPATPSLGAGDSRLGQTPAQLPGQPAASAGSGGELSGAPAAGTAEATKQSGDREDQITKGIANLSLAGLGLDPILMLRTLLASGHDPAQLAPLVVMTVEFMSNFVPPTSPLGSYIAGFYENPAATFDSAVGYVEELKGASDEYIAQLRESIINEVEKAIREERWRQTHDSFPWEKETEPDQADEKQAEPEPEEVGGSGKEEPVTASDSTVDSQPDPEVQGEAQEVRE